LKQRLFSIAAAVSLVLCIASVAVRPRSNRSTDLLEFARYADESHYHFLFVTSSRSLLNVCVGANTAIGTWAPKPGCTFVAVDPSEQYVEVEPTSWFRRLGFDYFPFQRSPTGWSVAFCVPVWCLTLITAMTPGLAVIWWSQRRRRSARGLCVSCGYDLRGTPERCPECGTAPRRQPHNQPTMKPDCRQV
jgi:hypothetical protein